MYFIYMYYLYYFTCMYLMIIHCSALCFRSEMTKIFPSDSEPPEETVELWTGGRQQQQQQQHLTKSKQQQLLRLFRCITQNTDSRRDELFDSTSKSKMKKCLHLCYACSQEHATEFNWVSSGANVTMLQP